MKQHKPAEPSAVLDLSKPGEKSAQNAIAAALRIERLPNPYTVEIGKEARVRRWCNHCTSIQRHRSRAPDRASAESVHRGNRQGGTGTALV